MNNPFRINQLASALMLASGVGVMPGLSNAAVIGSQTGTDITLPAVTTLIGDKITGIGLYGIFVPLGSPGTVTIGSGSAVRVIDAGSHAQGILIRGANSQLTADKLNVNISGKTANGIELMGNQSHAELGTGSSVTTVGTGNGFAEAITIGYGSSLRAEKLQISTQGESGIGLHINGYGSQANIGDDSAIQTNGINSHGIQVDTLVGDPNNGVASLTANHLIINTLGDNSQGIDIQTHSTVNLGSLSTIITTGNVSAGIWSLGDFIADHLTISTSGETSAGLTIRDQGSANVGAGSVIATAQSGGIVAMGDNAVINFMGSEEERNAVQSSGSYAVSSQWVGAEVNLQNTDIVINPITEEGAGLWAVGGVINSDNLNITSSTAKTYGVLAEAGGVATFQGDLNIDMGSPAGIAMGTRINEGFMPGTIAATGKMNLNGSVQSAGGLIDLNLTSGSLWAGSASSDNVDNGHLNIALTDSTWRVAGSSTLDDLQLNNALVDLSAASDNARYSTLTVANLSGNGDFTLRTSLAGDGEGVNNAGDKIIVTQSSAGNYRLNIQNRGSAATNGSEVLTLVETPDGTATFTGRSDIELGGYVYSVNPQGTNWVLSSPARADDSQQDIPVPPDENSVNPPAPPADDSNPAPVPPANDAVLPVTPPVAGDAVISSSANAGANFLNIGYLMNYAETQTLLQRIGDVRQGQSQGNVWLRGVGGRFSGFSGGKLSNFSMNYSGYQFGVDKRVSDTLPLYLGLFMGATEGSPHYDSGKGTTRSSHFGAYATWLNEEGYYVDGVIKVNRLRNQFSVNDTQNNRVSGNGVSSGLSASLEAGKKFRFSPLATGFYLEPQLQMTVGHQDGSALRASNGLNIGLSNYKSALGRASVLAGYEISQRDYKLNAYVKTGVMREFSGNASYTLNGSQENLSFKGNGWNNGIGVSAQLSNHTLFLEADALDGHRFDQRQINAGYRFSF